VHVSHTYVGCFPRSIHDVDDHVDFEDTTCVNVTSGPEPCRSGLPFYRFLMHAKETLLDCFSFCLSKGLDLSGLIYSPLSETDECRCGAKADNQGIWGHASAPKHLILPEESVPEDDPRCKNGGVLVWEYTGGLESGSVPVPLLELSEGDTRYIDGIVGHMDPEHVNAEGSDDHSNATNATMAAAQVGSRGLCVDSENPLGNGQPCSKYVSMCSKQDDYGILMRRECPLACGKCSQAWGWLSCYPNNCGPGGGPWLNSKASDNKVYINYYFTSNIDDIRIEAFEKAKAEWEAHTCIRFVDDWKPPAIRVTIKDYNSCSSGVGYPGANGYVDLNLGWCDEVWEWGSIMHEIGHALGMNHEQNRPDGPDQQYTPEGYRGPYLHITWHAIERAWVPQWQGQDKSYIGSKTAGYEHYDYESMMHYGLGDVAEIADKHTLSWEPVPGQRTHLSRGDIEQITDLYQCGGAPAAAPAPAPVEPSGCYDAEDPYGQSCSSWAAQGACATSNGIRKSCPYSCKLCEGDCFDSTELVYEQACFLWKEQRGPDCSGNSELKKYCPYSCSNCR